MLNKVRKNTLIAAIISYAIFIISTFAGDEFIYSLFSVVTSFLLFLILICCIKDIGRFGTAVFMIAMGIFFWCVGDTIFLVNQFILGIEPLSLLVRTIYLMPNYFFGAAIIIWFYERCKGRPREFSYLLVNTFCLSIPLLVLANKVIYMFSKGHFVSGATELRAILYFFINFSIIFLDIQIFYSIGTKGLRKGTSLLSVGILLYVLLDLIYTFREAIGQEPENIYMDILYMGFMFLMVTGIYIQTSHQYEFTLRGHDYSSHAMHRRFFLAGIILIVDLWLGYFGTLSQNEVLYIILAVLMWLIMIYVLNTGYLDEKLFKSQAEQNTILENMVGEKTRDLLEVNEHLRKLSSTDMLTGLYNRRYSRMYVSNLMEMAKKESSGLTVFCIDLNGFKKVNDTYGHDMGDRVLEELAERLQQLPEDCRSFRTGGDEFMVVCNRVYNPHDVEMVGNTIRNIFREPVRKDNYLFRLSGSIGSATYPKDCKDPSLLIQYADAAMYSVKHSEEKDGYRAFDMDLIQVVGNRRKLSNILSVAEPRDFQLFFQPETDAGTGEIVGIEVFPHLRGELEKISPNELIPIMEEVGIMTGVGQWILQNALVTARDWNERIGRTLLVNINLSPLQLADQEFTAKIKKITEEVGYEPENVVLDVANEVVMGASQETKDALKSLKEQGFTLSINDFGGGEINLSYVIECGFDILKLSRSVVKNAEHSEAARKLITSICAVADDLNLMVVAVGVENENQAGFLKDLNITRLQGYLYGMPIKAIGFEKAYLNLHDEQ